MSDDSGQEGGRVNVKLSPEERRTIRVGMALADAPSMAEFLKDAGLEKAAQLQADEAARNQQRKEG